MKRLSIKTRITIWYTAFLVLLAGAMLAFVFSMGGKQLAEDAEAAVIDAVESMRGAVELDDGILELDGDADLYANNTHVSIYGISGELFFGKTPSSFDSSLPFLDGEFRTAGDYYVYDRLMYAEDYGDIWVRGVAVVSVQTGALSTLARFALIALPFIVLCAALGGYLITRRAFLPVRRMADTAERIGQSGDLSARIDLGAGGDEIHSLAATFDRMLDRLQAVFEKEKRFTSDASHELRTPTAAIIAQSEYALENPNDSPEALTEILSQGRRMNAILNQLLLLARSDANAALQLEILDMSVLCEMVLLEQRESTEAQEKRLVFTSCIQPSLLIRGDELMLMRMLLNLLNNAVRYGKAGGNVRFTLVRRNPFTISGCVSDDGPGISPADLPHIWERFYQADASRTSAGAGLGLPLVKWIAEAHGGRVWCESEINKGSSFCFELPEYNG